ncbi:uncharacterized protein KY384_004483 [Bacidia gigantensis]|uniref:uncharacterized protein n=1 Tax=Bacidia gigantensis TaxID=2732470 RepID=UPI001D04785A|nr:uncharacterized protein KY384_004483 [Bacidia gigantensis]KAG8531126.1 hypothetical protein KY384_004483 [Bacidia gigantensis]
MASLVTQLHPQSSKIPHYTTTYPFIAPSKFHDSLEGKVVLITGAGKGIGRASALAFAAAGARVACVARTKSDLDSLVAQIEKQSSHDAAASGAQENETFKLAPRAIAIPGDVTDPWVAPFAVNKTREQLGPVDILINSAGISHISDLEHEVDIEEHWKVMETTMLGTMAFTQAVLKDGSSTKGMLTRLSGTIINVVSAIGGTLTLPYFSAYSAAKAAQSQYSKCIHLELKDKDIKVFAVHPCMSHETSIGVGAVNEKAVKKNPELQKWLQEDFLPVNSDRAVLPADTFVALASLSEAKILCGRFLDATYDLEKQISLASAESETVGAAEYEE